MSIGWLQNDAARVDSLELLRREMTTWTTKEREIIPYSKLKDSHLLNIIAMLRRNLKDADSVACCLQGDAALLEVDIYVEHTDAKLLGLETEAVKRGLKV